MDTNWLASRILYFYYWFKQTFRCQDNFQVKIYIEIQELCLERRFKHYFLTNNSITLRNFTL